MSRTGSEREPEAPLARTMFESGPVENSDVHEQALMLQRGGTLSRFLLVDRIGAGGMGVVWAAYDPELDRKLAIKLLRPRRADGRIEEARTRLIREAQAMAQLSHPNVIAVHDVGYHAGQVFLAMEFVEGRTLGRWVRNTRRDWREIVEMFVQAGRGLAAAHRAGIVHRDFKPDNVLIGEGRARVTDFGLARSVETTTSEDLDPGASSSGARLGLGSTRARAMQSPLESINQLEPALASPLTRTGIMVGTPAYMAPEQFESGQFDARSDQFSFCVALWEALYGQRPFGGRTLDELGSAVMSGQIREPPGDVRVPGFVDRALRRGLSVKPEQRWPSMDELLRELQRDPALGWRRWMIAGALVASFCAALILTPMLSEPQVQAVDPCPDAGAQLEGVWDEARRAELEAAVLRHAAGDPIASWDRIEAALDGYAHSWLTMHEDACEATHVRHEQSAALLDLRMQCLDARRVELGAAIDLLADGEAKVVDSGMQLLAGLSPIEPCGRRAYLESTVPIPADERLAAKVAGIRERLARAKARVDVGDAGETIQVLRGLLEEAEASAYAPLRAEVLSELGFASGGSGTAEDTRALLERAVVESIRAGLDAQAARAGIELIYVVGVRLGEVDEGLRWAARVEAWHDRLDALPLSRARAAVSKGAVLQAKGELDRADEQLRSCLQLLGVDDSLHGLEGLGPAESVTAGWALGTMALVAYGRGDFRGAYELLGASETLHRRVHGTRHASTEFVQLNRAGVAMVLGEWPQARALLEQILPGMQARRERSPAAYALTQINLVELRLGFAALGLVEAGELAELVEPASAALDSVITAFSDSSPRVAESLAILARLDRMAGRLAEAELRLARAQAILDAAEQADPMYSLPVVLERGRLLVAQGRLDDARVLLEQLLDDADEAGRRLRHLAAEARARLAQVHVEQGRVEQGRPLLERALVIWDELEPRGHPQAIASLELLASIDDAQAVRLRSRAAAIREGLAGR